MKSMAISEKEKCAIIVRKVPLQLRQKLKAKAAMEGTTIQGKIIELIADYVKETGK